VSIFNGAIDLPDSLTTFTFSTVDIFAASSPGVSAIPPVTAPIPEPETYAMLLAGLALLAAATRRRRLQAAHA